MQPIDLTKRLAAHSLRNQTIYWCNLAHELTILARDSELLSRIGESGVLKTLLELSHLITGQIGKLLRDDPSRYPNDILVEIALESAQRAGIEAEFRGSMARSELQLSN